MNEKVSQSMSQPQGMSAAARRNRRIAVSTLCVAIVGLVGYYLWLAQETPAGPAIPPDPRLTFETPYRNVHPDVQYVDDSRCTQCHQEIADNYGKHPMANSLRPIGNGQPTERLSTEDGNPFQRDGYEYSIRRAAGELIQSEIRRDSQGKVVSKAEETMALAIGAGRHATSYLFERDGCYFYSPVTWYSRRGRWDISPAFVNTPHHFTETAFEVKGNTLALTVCEDIWHTKAIRQAS
ncbi:MAG: hypothetical protein ABGZ35_06415, partial [Planctomycetaceae bacterium]